MANGAILGQSQKSAYQAAVEGGYQGTEEQFNQTLAENMTVPISIQNGGTGVSSVGGTDYSTTRFRGSQLRSTDTNPTINGTINWTYK